MAAFNKLGSLLRQSALTRMRSNGSAPHLFNAARFMSARIFVSGLSLSTDNQSLREAFTTFGEVTEARVITDRETGRSRCFGFVNFASEHDAKKAADSMDGQDLGGRNVRVNCASDRPSGGAGYGGYGGGGRGRPVRSGSYRIVSMNYRGGGGGGNNKEPWDGYHIILDSAND